jgi:hypothetical protein
LPNYLTRSGKLPDGRKRADVGDGHGGDAEGGEDGCGCELS